MAKQEKKFRVFQKELEALEEEIIKTHPQAMQNEEILTKLMGQIQEELGKLKQMLQELETYASWSSKQILDQWAKDMPEDFYARNRHMLTRYANMEKHLVNLVEQLRRRQPSLVIQLEIETAQREQELYFLRKKMIRNYWVKGAVVLPVTSGIGYVAYKENEEDGWIASQIDKLGRIIDHVIDPN